MSIPLNPMVKREQRDGWEYDPRLGRGYEPCGSSSRGEKGALLR